MPTFQFEAMDATGQQIKDAIEAQDKEQAQATIREMGYFVTKISVKRGEKGKTATGKPKRKKGLSFGTGGTKMIVPRGADWWWL